MTIARQLPNEMPAFTVCEVTLPIDDDVWMNIECSFYKLGSFIVLYKDPFPVPISDISVVKTPWFFYEIYKNDQTLQLFYNHYTNNFLHHQHYHYVCNLNNC